MRVRLRPAWRFIGEGLARARSEGLSLEASADRTVALAKAQGVRLPGFGHRVHTTIDPRTDVLFGLARQHGLAGDGIRFIQALERSAAMHIKPLPINIDGSLAAVLHDLGLCRRCWENSSSS